MGKDIQEDKGMLQEVDRKLRLLIGAFTGILYEDDDIFMEKMRRKKNSGSSISTIFNANISDDE